MMPCCGKSLPEISLQNIFRKVCCISACCGGKIIIQDSAVITDPSCITIRKVPQALVASIPYIVP